MHLQNTNDNNTSRQSRNTSRPQSGQPKNSFDYIVFNQTNKINPNPGITLVQKNEYGRAVSMKRGKQPEEEE